MSYQSPNVDTDTQDDDISMKFAGTIVWAVLTFFIMAFQIQTGASVTTVFGFVEIVFISPLLAMLALYMGLDAMLRDGEWRTAKPVIKFMEILSALASRSENSPKRNQ